MVYSVYPTINQEIQFYKFVHDMVYQDLILIFYYFLLHYHLIYNDDIMYVCMVHLNIHVIL